MAATRTERARTILTVLAPALLVLGLDLVYEPEVVENLGGAARYDGLSIPALILPAVLGLALALIGLVLLPRVLVTGWSARALLRLAGWCGASMALAVVAGEVIATVSAPAQLWLVLAGVVLGVLAMFGAGAVVASVARTSDGAALTGAAVSWPLVVVAGVLSYPPLMSDTMQRVAAFTPVGAAVQAIQHGWFGPGLPGAPGPGVLLAVAGGWAVLLWAVAGWCLRRRTQAAS